MEITCQVLPELVHPVSVTVLDWAIRTLAMHNSAEAHVNVIVIGLDGLALSGPLLLPVLYEMAAYTATAHKRNNVRADAIRRFIRIACTTRELGH